MILLAFHHGLRSSEVCRLKWDRIFLDREEMLVVRVKGSKTKEHPLYPDDVAALKKLKKLNPESSIWVFRSESRKGTGHVSESGFQKIVERAGELAGIKYPIHPHMLRHSCGFWLRKHRYDLLDIRDWLGHVSVKNTERYAEAAPIDSARSGSAERKGVDDVRFLHHGSQGWNRESFARPGTGGVSRRSLAPNE